MLREIARIALNGMNSNNEEVMKACLEKIWIISVENVSELEASKKMNDNQKGKIKADDDRGSYLIKKYGTYKGHSKFKLALDFFQMSNDRFFEIYKFNFVPRGELYEVARSYITGRQLNEGLIVVPSISANMQSRSELKIDVSNSIANQIRNSMSESFRLGG